MIRPVLLLAVALTACTSFSTTGEDIVVSAGDRSLRVRVEIADDEAERRVGLMNRTSVPRGTGMLFVYPGIARWGGIWMKSTLVPLDVAFSASGRIVAVFTLRPCRADPCPTTAPEDPYDAVLEVPAGTFAAAGLGAGARLSRA